MVANVKSSLISLNVQTAGQEKFLIVNFGSVKIVFGCLFNSSNLVCI